MSFGLYLCICIAFVESLLQSETNIIIAQLFVFTAELYAIKMALDKILKSNLCDKNYTFFSDSQSALLALKSRTITSPILLDIKNMIEQARSRKLEVDFCWVAGHVNISGNEKADRAAKEAAGNVSPLIFTRPIPRPSKTRPGQWWVDVTQNSVEQTAALSNLRRLDI